MRAMYGNADATSNEIQGTFVPGRDKIVPAPQFGNICRMLWPEKTAAHIAAIAKRDERSAKRWLSGEFEPPFVVVNAVVNEMMGHWAQR